MIGIYGGTFDPVHYGHLRTALEVQEALGLAELRLVPCQIPPHRGEPGARPEQRLALLQAALNEAPPGLRIDARELERPGPSYMVDTLASLRGELGAERPLVLIVGLDAFLGLHRWRHWRTLFELAHVAVMRRPGFEPEWPPELARELERRLTSQAADLSGRPAGLIHCVTVTQLDISASRIRALIASGRSARYLTPDAVLECISRMGLYWMTEPKRSASSPSDEISG
jgi:nicotinate-nucleotide adenylyltransferase